MPNAAIPTCNHAKVLLIVPMVAAARTFLGCFQAPKNCCNPYSFAIRAMISVATRAIAPASNPAGPEVYFLHLHRWQVVCRLREERVPNNRPALCRFAKLAVMSPSMPLFDCLAGHYKSSDVLSVVPSEVYHRRKGMSSTIFRRFG